VLALIAPRPIELPEGFEFVRDDEGRLGLRDLERPDQKPIIVDFVSSQLTYRREHGLSKNQPLSKALGLKSLNPDTAPFVFDATAGLGVDAFMMACLGCRVRAVERSPVVFALLEDGYQRLKNEADRRAHEEGDASLQEIARRLSFESGEAHAILLRLDEQERPDVVYLDPMYPEEGRSKSALPKKGMQAFRRLIGADTDTELVWEAAVKRARARVVVKRPLQAPVLGGRPSHSFEGKTARYDMYLCRGQI
jgi:16S rRNA (guanine1516-N2)-methyltransferase